MVPLGSSRLFSSLTVEELKVLEKVAEHRMYTANQSIFREGDAGDGVYVLLEGTVQISALVHDDERRVLSRLGPADFFGEMAVLDSEPRSATATAETGVRVVFFPRQQLMEYLERWPKFAINMVREFSLRMRDFNRQYIGEVLQAERLTLVGRFARSIVHDFKNPLNVIGLSAEMAAMETATPEMRASAKARIRKQVNRLSTMINELLEFTRGAQKSSVLAENDYDTYVSGLVDEIRPEVAVKNVIITLETPAPGVRVLMDPARLAHVFYNLIHNAVDAMVPDGGQIRLRFSVADHEVTTEIEDSGKGVAPEIASRLFEAFATFGKAQGTGLGLSICRKIIEDHHGRIWAKSEPDRGAIFVFTLPLKK